MLCASSHSHPDPSSQASPTQNTIKSTMQFASFIALICLTFGVASIAKPIPDHAVAEVRVPSLIG